MRVAHTNLFTFSELNEQAQKKALEKHRDWNTDGFDWWDCVYEDAERIATILGIEIKNIWFGGFSSQGDGACFDGHYSYSEESEKKIREYAPQDAKLHRIADDLAALQHSCSDQLSADVTHRGFYYHEGCTEIDVSREDEYEVGEHVEDKVAGLLRDFMRWIYRSLEREYDYLISDEAIRESLEANGIEFNENGTIGGLHEFETHSRVFVGTDVDLAVHRLINAAQWFEVMPLSGDEWQVTVEIENEHLLEG